MRPTSPLISWLAWVGVVVASLAGAQPLQGDAAQSFERAWLTARNAQPPRGWVFQWRRETLASLTLPELEAQEASLAQTPAHPDWQRLRDQRRLIEGGPDVTEYDVWWDGPASLRFNVSTPGNQLAPYVDFVITPNAVFCLNPDQLTVLEPGAAPPAGRDFYVFEGDALWALALLTRGGLGAPRYQDATVERVRIDGDVLVASLSHNANHIEFTLGSDMEGGEPHVRSLAYFMADRPDAPAQQYRFQPRQPDPAFESGVHPVVEKFGPGGRLVERLTWLGSRAMEPGEFARVTTIPAPDGQDPVRGPMTFTSLWDFRTGQVTGAAVGSTPMPIPNYVPPASLAWLRPAGWITAGVLVASLIGLRVWRGRRTARNN